MEFNVLIFLGAYLGIILSLIHLFHNNIFIKNEKERKRAKAFTAGISLTYIFIHLLPRAIPGYFEELFYGAILASFLILMAFDNYLYHSKTPAIRKYREKEHALIFAFYNFIGGATIIFFLNISFLNGVVFFLPMALHNLTSAASIKEMEKSVEANFSLKAILSFTPLFGIIVATLYSFGEVFSRVSIGLLAGSFLYIAFRELIPKKKEGNISNFIVGIIVMLIFLSVEFFV